LFLPAFFRWSPWLSDFDRLRHSKPYFSDTSAISVREGSPITRRRLHTSVRKTLLSYYSEEETAEIVKAAKRERNRLDVPEWLLKQWGITVDPTFSDVS
jgi:hypothetical protein